MSNFKDLYNKKLYTKQSDKDKANYDYSQVLSAGKSTNTGVNKLYNFYKEKFINDVKLPKRLSRLFKKYNKF